MLLVSPGLLLLSHGSLSPGLFGGPSLALVSCCALLCRGRELGAGRSSKRQGPVAASLACWRNSKASVVATGGKRSAGEATGPGHEAAGHGCTCVVFPERSLWESEQPRGEAAAQLSKLLVPAGGRAGPRTPAMESEGDRGREAGNICSDIARDVGAASLKRKIVCEAKPISPSSSIAEREVHLCGERGCRRKHTFPVTARSTFETSSWRR